MLSTAAFNALLKTLEEPPEHVKFFATTGSPQSTRRLYLVANAEFRPIFASYC